GDRCVRLFATPRRPKNEDGCTASRSSLRAGALLLARRRAPVAVDEVAVVACFAVLRLDDAVAAARPQRAIRIAFSVLPRVVRLAVVACLGPRLDAVPAL